MNFHQDQIECDREVLPKPSRTTSVRFASARDAKSAVGEETYVMFRAGKLFH